MKSHKEVTKQYGINNGFAYYFCLIMEGSRFQIHANDDPEPGDPNTYGSCGSGSGSTTLVESR
jgi:hypothetical protein